MPLRILLMLATIVVLACSLSEDEIIPEMSHAEVPLTMLEQPKANSDMATKPTDFDQGYGTDFDQGSGTDFDQGSGTDFDFVRAQGSGTEEWPSSVPSAEPVYTIKWTTAENGQSSRKNEFIIDATQYTAPFPVNYQSDLAKGRRDTVKLPAGTYDILSATGKFDGNPCDVDFVVQTCGDVNKDCRKTGTILATIATNVAGWHKRCATYSTTRPFTASWAPGAKTLTLSAPAWIRCSMSTDYTVYKAMCEFSFQRAAPV